jgi:tyrosine-protein kinase Etk/Wzc
MKTNESDPSIAFIKHFLRQIYSIKYIYISGLILLLSVAYLFNKYSTKVYEVNATIGPVQDNRSRILGSGSNSLSMGLNTFVPSSTIENEINNLKSFSIVSSTIINLNFEVGYFKVTGHLLKELNELYKKSPFIVNIDKSHVQPIDTKFFITILSDSTYRITASQKEVSLYNYIDNQIINKNNIIEVDTLCHFNQTISNKYFKFSLTNNKEFFTAGGKHKELYYFQLYHLDYLAKLYLEKLSVVPQSFMASIININFRGENIQKIIDFVNTFIDSYLKDNLGKKNKISINTINFIDSQISEISDSLNLSESKLKNYRSANQVMDLSFQGQRIYEQMTLIETERSNLESQKRYYEYVINYLKTNSDISGVIPPTSANVADPMITQLITNLLGFYNQRSAISNNNKEKNLFLGQIESKITMQKQVILETAMNNLNSLNLSLNELNYRTDKLSKEISNLPKTEMNMVSMQRKYNLNDAIFTFLLQKRSEAAITLASNSPDFEVLEPAREITSKMTYPKTKLNYLIAFFLGILIPTAFLIISDLFNDKITNSYFIEHLLNRPVLGSIYNNKQKNEAVVANFPNSAISESFRNLRSSLFHKLKSEQSKVILITSSQPRDGKSFISFNLAASIASVGHKTIIIDCDLRRPVLHGKFGLDNSSGISNYLIKKVTIESITHKTSVENLSFISAGPVIPNPSELIAKGALDDFVNDLKLTYEYIIIDSSPLGLVADSIQLMKYASHVLLVTRINYTNKDVFANSLDAMSSNKFENFDVILNDLSLKKSPYSSYTGYYVKE